MGGSKGFGGNLLTKTQADKGTSFDTFPVSFEDRFHVGSPHGYIRAIGIDRILRIPGRRGPEAVFEHRL